MPEQTKASRVKNLLFTSAWLIPVFLIIPVFTILNLKMHLAVSGDLLLYNNAAFALVLALRFVWYLLKLGKDIRYGAERCVPKQELELDRPAAELRENLSRAGYRFESAGRYGEKRDLGYLGMTIVYGGLMLLLVFGSYDYLREYSIMVRLGVGEPIPLDGKGLTGEFEAGDLALTENLPKLQIRQQILPNAQWPYGATVIALLSPDDNKEVANATIAPGKSFKHSGMEFSMTKFLFDGLIHIQKGGYVVYDSFVKFLPLAKKKGEYSYVAKIVDKQEGRTLGNALLRPEKRAVLVDAKLEGKQIFNGELELWGEHKKMQGEYEASLEGLAQWSEIRVARARHTMFLIIGALLAGIGALLRIAIRPQRVWLEEGTNGCRGRATGKKTLQLLGK